jgi:prepilin-type N-terminal cleavage/methylation domain-containing protein
MLRNRRGFTLVELMTSVGIMAFVTICGFAVLLSTMRSYDSITVQAYSDSDAVVAMQKIVSDLREAKSYAILSSGTRLQLTYPITTANGYYNRQVADPTNTIDYYLSDNTGSLTRTGTYLWRNPSKGGSRIVARNIQAVRYTIDTSRSVQITVDARNTGSSGSKTTYLTERVVYLRNY